jgi:uncharacterized membrane protein YcaP (DUF421 family)
VDRCRDGRGVDGRYSSGVSPAAANRRPARGGGHVQFRLRAAIAFGAVLGRTVLGSTPTLGAGLVGMVTLFALQAGFGVVRRNRHLDRALNNLPLLLMVNGNVLPDRLRRAKMVEDELRQKLRLAGVHRYDDVGAVILERTGAISVLRRGETIAPELLGDVRSRELLADQHIQP